DFVKVYENIPIEAYRALLREAKMNSLTVAGHIPTNTVSLLEASNAGQRSIEHIRDPLLMCFTRDSDPLFGFFKEDHWNSTDVQWGLKQFKQCPDVIKAFRTNQTWLVPTLSVERSKVAVEDPLFVADPRRDSLPSSVRAGFNLYVAKKNAQTAADRRSDHLWWQTQQLLVARMNYEGIGILSGTDSACEGGLPGFSLHDELELLVASGLKSIEALRTATINPAQYLRRQNDLGTVQAGKLADLVLLDGNPLDAISNTKKIHAVFANGQYLSKGSLQSLVRRARKRVVN
ncbi:MAG: amidohydrolase family protein, partial [Pyrinomonadaceae bacterium]